MRLLIFISFFLYQITAFSQPVGVTFHQSSTITKVGVFYEIKDLVIIEARIWDAMIFEDFSFEVAAMGKFLRRENYELYGGVGQSVSPYTDLHGIIVLLGTNIYPFSNKKIGFHVELSPLFPEEENIIGVVRGSWGLRYRF